MSGEELELVKQVFESNWIAPAGPDIPAFEEEFCAAIGVDHAVALSSGTAALHLSLITSRVGENDEVFCSTLTFSACANAITYVNARPVFIDSDRTSWNMDPGLLEVELGKRSRTNRLPKALILVHIYGQSADIDPIRTACERFGVILIEDAAESLGATYKDQSPGTFGRVGVFSFNGNKILTTSGGGMIVSRDRDLIDHARYLATQARETVVHYEHKNIGYNYRLSNVLAAIGRGQLRVLQKRVARKRTMFKRYAELLKDTPGIEFMPEAGYGRSSCWLTCITIDPVEFGADRSQVIEALEQYNIESRPTWKPMHLQPVFNECSIVGGAVSEWIFEHGLCLPSGTAMTDDDIVQVSEIVRSCAK
jgi:pyridoxal phosphate-dependent aminotransferase EpsN